MTSSSNLTIVVEGKTDAQLVRALLGKELAERLRFFASQGRASLATVGRNLLVHEGTPVLIVMDADTRNPHLAQERQALTRMALCGVAPEELCKVFAFIPEIEVVFFEAPQALEQVLGTKLSEEMVNDGLIVPKEALSRLLGEGQPVSDYATFMTRIAPQVAGALASGKQATALRAVVESMSAPALSA